MSSRLLPLCALVVLSVACSEEVEGGGTGGGGSGASALKGCEDTADAVAKAAERCGSDYQTNYDAFVDAATGGKGCSAIVSIRDETALREKCIPYFTDVSCEDLSAGTLDESCRQQLQRPASFRTTLVPAGGVAAVMASE
jgi:hypothetical protein